MSLGSIEPVPSWIVLSIVVMLIVFEVGSVDDDVFDIVVSKKTVEPPSVLDNPHTRSSAFEGPNIRRRRRDRSKRCSICTPSAREERRSIKRL
jgi:hypothetical protein